MTTQITAGQKLKTLNSVTLAKGTGKVLYSDSYVVVYTKGGKKITDTLGGFWASVNAGFLTLI